MKKLFKSAIAVLLCVAIGISIAVPCFAKDKKTAFVVVSGMNTFPLTLDGEKVFPMSAKTVLKQAKGIADALIEFSCNKDFTELNELLFPPLREMFKELTCDSNGSSICNIETMQFSDSVEEYVDLFSNEKKDELGVVNAGIQRCGAENTYFFNYDWRLNPLDHADKLNELIKTIKSKNEYDRIVVSAYSMGGTVVCSYLYKFGSADVDSIVLASTAFQGTSCVGDMFNNRIELSTDGLLNRLAQLTRDNSLENLVNAVGEILKSSGITNSVDNFAEKFVNAVPDRLYSEFLTPVFGYMTGLWALCDDENYESAKEVMLNGTATDSFIETIDEYHYNVQQKAEALLKNAMNDTAVYIIAQYNMQGLPVSKTSSTGNNDYLIDTKYESGGAVCSDLGKTLPNGYVQQIDCGHNHVSYDGQIDASTCMFPESTWFVRDMGHVDFPVGASTDFIIWLTESEEQLTVFDNSDYPQFLKYNYGDNSLKPLNENTLKKTTSDKLLEIFKIIVSILKKYFVTLLWGDCCA